MVMFMKKIISVLLCLAMSVCIFSGCSKDESIDLIYPFEGDVKSYDPQVASTADEFLIIENCFEGLVRCDDEGNITPGCAESWTVSEDGLTYTFKIKQGLKWYIYPSVKEKMGEDFNPDVTANDFVYGLQRAVDPNTQCPLFPTVSGIVNANEIHSGSADVSSLGVMADGNYTLVINLTTPDDSFLETLSTAVAMPCNREFFESTNGRYGLDLKYTMFNGQFVITSVLDTSYVLKDNSAYNGPTKAKASDLTLKKVESDAELYEDVISGYYDAAYLRGYEGKEVSKKSGITLIPYSNTTWTFIMNSSSGIFSQKDARKAFALSVSEPNYEEYEFLTDAVGYIPPTCTANSKPYYEQSAAIAESADQQTAIELWKDAIDEADNYSISITVLAPTGMEDVAKELLQGVQAGIGSVSKVDDKAVEFSLKLETLTQSEIDSKIATGEYDVVLYPFAANSASPVSFLQTFDSSSVTFYRNEFEQALEDAASASSQDLISACEKCEKELYETYSFFPLFYESNYYAQAKGVSGVQFHPGTGRVNFINATRE